MNTAPATEGLAPPPAEKPASTVSRLVRRIHMFTGLFLAPWMLMYALSTLVMTHRELVGSLYASKQPALVTERELEYSRSFPATSSREQIAEAILQDLGLSGTHWVSGGRDGNPLLIHRQHALTIRQITFDSSKNKLLLQREQFRSSNFLDRLHRRRGYSGYPLENTWGFTVDVACVGILVWVASGVIMCWRLRCLKGWGAFALGSGLLSFLLLIWRL